MTMKNLKKIALALALAGISLSASAQRSWDLFYVPRTIQLTAPFNYNANTGVQYVTNGPIDVKLFDGLARIDFTAITNTGTSGGTLTATLYGSSTAPSLTSVGSLSSIGSYGLINSTTSINYTNSSLGSATNIYATNPYFLPGTITTPTAATAGFATRYLDPTLLTTTGAITLTGKSQSVVGFNVGDAPRYLYVVYTVGGSVTNWVIGATLTGMTHGNDLY